MSGKQRSPIGELVYQHRTRLNMTQKDLALAVRLAASADPDAATTSKRTITALERHCASPSDWVAPRASTVAALISVFGLSPGTAGWQAFIDAAHFRRPGGTPSIVPWPSLPRPGPAPRELLTAGREPHLEQLRRAFHQAASGTHSVLFVSGTAGAGKSSLLQLACSEAIETLEDAVVLWGECADPAITSEPLMPFRQVFSILAGAMTTAAPQHLVSSRNQQRLVQRATAVIPTLLDESSALFDRVISANTLRDIINSGSTDDRTAEALKRAIDSHGDTVLTAGDLYDLVFRVLARYTAGRPTILILEDLHWADPGTIALLSYLGWRIRTHDLPLALIGSFRPVNPTPVSAGAQHPLLAMLRDMSRFHHDLVVDLATTIGGQPGRDFVDAAVSLALPQASEDFRDSLFEKTNGLPLFAVGLIRRCQAAGAFNPAASPLPLEWSLDPAHLPAEIDTLFRDQVSGLSPDLQALLNAASVQGQAFSAEVIMHVLGLSRSDMIARLDARLYRHLQLVEPGGIRTVAGQPSHDYRFSHVLLRDFVYHQMTDLERTDGHTATAEAILTLYGSGEHDGSATIALHFRQAGDRRNAGANFVKAGIHALEQRNHDVAHGYFSQVAALDLHRESPFTVIQSMIGLGNSDYGLGNPDRAIISLERAHALALQEHQPLLVATCLTSMGRLDFDSGRMRDGATRLEQAIDLLMQEGERREACRSLILLSHTYEGSGLYDAAAAAAQGAIELATDLHDAPFLVSAMTALGNCWIDIGLLDQAMDINERAIGICDDIGDSLRAMICGYNVSLCEIERHGWVDALNALRPILDPAHAPSLRLVASARFNHGLIAEGQGNLAEAELHYRASLDLRRRLRQDALTIDSLAGTLRAAMDTQHHSLAQTLLDDLVAHIANHGLDGIEHTGRLFVTLVTTCQAFGNHDAARDHARLGVETILGRAGHLADPHHRTSYLSAVPSHHQFLELAEVLGVVRPGQRSGVPVPPYQG